MSPSLQMWYDDQTDNRPDKETSTMLNHLDLDARRIETRAMKLVERLGLDDDYGCKGGLHVEFDSETNRFFVCDEAFSSSWDTDEDGFLTNEQWDQIHCFLCQFSDHGCAEDHEHYDA